MGGDPRFAGESVDGKLRITTSDLNRGHNYGQSGHDTIRRQFMIFFNDTKLSRRRWPAS